jgi:hypothetical protein
MGIKQERTLAREQIIIRVREKTEMSAQLSPAKTPIEGVRDENDLARWTRQGRLRLAVVGTDSLREGKGLLRKVLIAKLTRAAAADAGQILKWIAPIVGLNRRRRQFAVGATKLIAHRVVVCIFDNTGAVFLVRGRERPVQIGDVPMEL